MSSVPDRALSVPDAGGDLWLIEPRQHGVVDRVRELWHYRYLWWYFAEGARTTSALKERARQRGNLVIDNAFATHPGFSI